MILRGLALLIAAAAGSLPAADVPLGFADEPAGIGDPNPIFAGGAYWVFYLKNEGRHPFWMTRSRDLVRWSSPVEALPTGGAADPDVWTGSGSIVADPAGGYRLFYTGHRPGRPPAEVVMQARASELGGPWRKRPGIVAGPPDYDAADFRDPLVLWNPDARAWWMILASRQHGRAVIARYTSPDLDRWVAAPPLYDTASPLNLEVPDLFAEGGRWFLLYSDQREASRQVRYLSSASSDGPYRPEAFDALDGPAFYAGKSAGTGDKRRLFGWVAHRRERSDAAPLVWGGDLIAHALHRTANGTLAVRLEPEIAARFTRRGAILSPDAAAIGRIGQASRTRAFVRARRPGTFQLILHGSDGAPGATIDIDPAAGTASFGTDARPSERTAVRFPPARDGVWIDLLLDPVRSLGTVYLADERALSFRFYGLRHASAAFAAPGGFADFRGEVRYAR